MAYPAVERESEGRDELGRDFQSLHERVTMTHDVGRGQGREASSPFVPLLRDKLREPSCGCVSASVCDCVCVERERVALAQTHSHNLYIHNIDSLPNASTTHDTVSAGK